MDDGTAASVPAPIGRKRAARRLTALVAAAAKGAGKAVVVRGEPGIGKTTLLTHVIVTAPGIRVIQVRGTEPEAALRYGSLADLLEPLSDQVAHLPPRLREPIEISLALQAGEPPGPDMLGAAVLGVLAAAGPLMVLIEDVQWVDPASRYVLLSVARQLAAEPVALLMTLQYRPDDTDLVPGLDTLTLAGLSVSECRDVLAGHRIELPEPELARLVEETGGNPRALLTAAADHLRPRVPVSTRRRAEMTRLWGREADLTAQPASRAERLLAAATGAQLAGLPDAARRWCEEALALNANPAFVADVELVRGRATACSGHPIRAIDGLVRAGESILPIDAQRAADLFAEAAMPAAMANRVPTMLEVTRRSVGLRADLGQPTATALTTRAAALVLAGRVAEGRRCLDNAERLGAAPYDVWDSLAVTLSAQTRMWLEEYGAADRILDSVICRARCDGGPWILAYALAVRAELAWWTGRWAEGHTDATEAVRWGQNLRQVGLTGYAMSTLARFEASRGNVVACRNLMDRALRHLGPYGVDSIRVHIDAVLGLAALAVGDPETATQHLDRARRAAEQGGLEAAGVMPFQADLVEAHIRAGHPDQAREALDRLDKQAAADGLTFTNAAALRYRGLLAPEAELARAYFARARELPGLAALPFERARTLLCEGEALRRLRHPVAARPLLLQVRGTFSDLGAQPWVTRVDSELAATGAGPTGRSHPEPHALTPRELEIARSVAAGLNTAEAASAHFISRRTVEAHLARIYRKLGVRSRTELARKLPPVTGEVESA